LVRASHEIRRRYLDFFAERGHAVRPSAPLVPRDDPSLLFTVAGMVQFKPYYSMPPADLPFKRAATVQKCLRVNDLESVGRTLRHHTFFEMLGNFSFGDYFKRETIAWAWEFVTGELQLDRERIWISVFEKDDEAATLWRQVAGVPAARIVRLGKKDNFWGPAGETGACGPSSELYFDTGAANGCGQPGCAVGCDCDRYIEFWNLVFPQFDQQKDGTLQPLAHPGIDTGMGLERTAFIAQGAPDNFHSDLFRPIVSRLQELSGVEYERDAATRLAMNAVADHVRALVFTLAEGIYPSNEGRGYVLRRILRRACGKLRALGVRDPFLYRLVDPVVDVMGPHYTELAAVAPRVAALIEAEEQRFVSTLEAGMARFETALQAARGQAGVLAGRDIFTLYDTYGFPPELTIEMAGDRGVRVDRDGFAAAMREQRERARAGAAFKARAVTGETPELVLAAPGDTEFLGWERTRDEDRLQLLRWLPGARSDADANPDLALAGEAFELVLERTPFYATSGGQVADSGLLSSSDLIWRVTDVRKERGRIVHTAVLLQHPSELRSWEDLAVWVRDRGELRVLATVEEDMRGDTARNHTATHLLHAALKKIVGPHVVQAGSLVAPDRLRFDFSHFAPLGAEEIRHIETSINDLVLRNLDVQTEVKDYDEAVAGGAVALFGEKYDPRVRVVSVGDYSTELCGGTHVRRTGDIGLFVITAEGSIASGVRRIEALTGRRAEQWVAALRQQQHDLVRVLGLGPGQDPVRKSADLVDENKRLRRELQAAQAKLAGGLSSDLMDKATDVNGARVIAARVDVAGVEALRDLADTLRREMKSGVAVLSTEIDEKLVFLAMVTDDLVKRGVKAGDLVNRVARVTGGGGGGKANLAQAGGRDKTRWQEALDEVLPAVRALL
jgi:alanyl-tRNA synthetase